MESPFDVLGVDPDADEATVVEAYKRRVKEAHPDHGGTKEEFQRVRTAYEQIQAGEEETRRDVGRVEESDDDRRNGYHPRSERPGESAPEEGPERPERSRVEYLNYDVLADHGWDLGDDDLFEKASAADLAPDDYGQILVEEDETLLEAAENRGFAWPFACRGGACTNCAVAVKDGEMPTPPGHILPPELIDKGIRLACISAPTTEDSQVVYNVKHLPGVDELRLPPGRFERAHAND